MVTLKRGYVEFCFYRPHAASACVAGDFNGWRTDAAPMTRGRDGYWRAKLRLPPGTHRFRYCLDGHDWFADFAAFGIEPGPFGPVSVIWVPSTRAIQQTRLETPCLLAR